MRYIVALMLLALVGCATPEQRAQQVLQAYGPYCEKLGYTPNTDAWRQCIQAEDMRDAMYLQRSRDYMFGWHCLHSPRFC